MSQSGQWANIGVRNSTHGDLPALLVAQRLAQLAVEAGWAVDTPVDELLLRRDVFDYLLEAQVPLGCVVVGPPSESWFDDRATGEVLAWFLHPDAWGHGFGRKLLVQGVTVIKRRGWERAVIWLPEFALRGADIVRRMQFEASGATRARNTGTGVVEEACYQLDLADWF